MKLGAALLPISLLLCPLAAASADAQEGASAGQPMVAGADARPSSYHRVELQCPVKPEGAVVTVLPGYPEIQAEFSMPGHYECELEIGIITKTGATGAYRRLGASKLIFEVHPESGADAQGQ